MKMKHNKKRNTAFLFEVLSKELTKQILRKDKQQQAIILETLKMFFANGTLLNKELKLYKYLAETKNLNQKAAVELVKRVQQEYDRLDETMIFNEQSRLISHINKNLSKDVYNYYVPSYKNLASIYQMFDRQTPLPKKVILEQHIVHNLVNQDNEPNNVGDVKLRNSVVTSIVKIFNEKYSDLLEEQKTLLRKFIYSVEDASEFKFYINEEVARLRKALEDYRGDKDVAHDKDMKVKYDRVFEILDSFKNDPVLTESKVSDLMKVQLLVSELNK
jgi:hypothetical protein